MVDTLATGLAGLLWLVTLANVRRLRHRDAAGLWLWANFCVLALATTLFCPWVPSVLDAIFGTGAGQFADPAARSLVLVAAFCSQSLLRVILRPARHRPEFHAMSLRRALTLAVALVALWLCFAVAVNEGAESLGSFAQPGPWSTAYVLVFVAYLGYALAEITSGCLRYASSARGPLSRGLYLIAAGCGLGMGYLLIKVLSALALFLGTPIPFAVEATLGRSLAIGAGAFVAAGSSWPAAVKLARGAAHRRSLYRVHRRLHVLWAALTSSVPAVAFEPDRGVWRDRLSMRDLDFRVYRRLIEIRDARLALRPLLDAEVAAGARAKAEACGLSVLAAAAFTEAAVLRAAVARAQRHGDALARPWAERGVEGDSVPSEIEWFTAVAAYFSEAGATCRIDRGAQQVPRAERKPV